MTREEKQANWTAWVVRRATQTVAGLREQAQRIEDDAKRFEQVATENAALRKALRWYVENDDTVDDIPGNEFWIAGRDRARALLGDPPEENGPKVLAYITAGSQP